MTWSGMRPQRASSQGGKGSHLPEWTKWIPLVAAAVAVVLAVILVWQLLVDDGNDPRAYPGSQSQSLDEMLDYYHLRLPECAQSSVRFARFSQFTSDSFYLYFTGGDSCVSEFLRVNGLDDEETFTQYGLPFRPGRGKEFGWPEDEREYVAVDGTLTSSTNPSQVAVEIIIDYSTKPSSLYLWAGIL